MIELTPAMIAYFVWFPFTLLCRDGQSGKMTVDDYGARTGKSPGTMRQLNINGPLYVGKWPWPKLSPSGIFLVRPLFAVPGLCTQQGQSNTWKSGSCPESPFSHVLNNFWLTAEEAGRDSLALPLCSEVIHQESHAFLVYRIGTF